MSISWNTHLFQFIARKKRKAQRNLAVEISISIAAMHITRVRIKETWFGYQNWTSRLIYMIKSLVNSKQ